MPWPQEGLKVGVICKQKFRRDVYAVVRTDDDVAPHSALEKEFNEILKLTLSVSFNLRLEMAN